MSEINDLGLPNEELQKKDRFPWIRITALILMFLLLIFGVVAYDEIIKYNKISKDPCALCMEVNKDVICQKVDYNGVENNNTEAIP